MSGTGAEDDPRLRESQLGDALLDAMRGGLRIIGGMVQMAAGITRLLAATALKAASAVEDAAKVTEESEEKPEPKPRPKPR